MLSRTQRIARYGGAAPRYTSYPTANHFGPLDAHEVVDALPHAAERVSVYVHVPYCTQLCWYCGCNTTIRRDRSVGDALVEDLLSELTMVGAHLPVGARLGQLALGGGTPNFLPLPTLERLLDAIEAAFKTDEHSHRSIELDPRTVESAQLESLTARGFQRVSLGVQSLHPDVQQAVNRPLEPSRLCGVVRLLRAGDAHSINLDLMVGLPRQTTATLDHTLRTVLALRPERLAVFQYAHMPRLRPAQKLLARHGLPDALERDALFRHVTARLLDAGYVRVGFDHFALPEDPLAVAATSGALSRNFQGFTEDATQDLIALGPSAIGQIGDLYYQNHRDVEPWREAVRSGLLPVARGIRRTEEDARAAAVIYDLMCRHEADIRALEPLSDGARRRLEELAIDGLVRVEASRVHVTEAGEDFVRAIATVFDPRLDPSAHSVVS